MKQQCPWCFIEYELTPYTEVYHLLRCKEFQEQPIVKWHGNTPYVRLPDDDPMINSLVQKTPLARRSLN